jgi:aminoglycoside 3-N-acetyltransferase I
MSYNRYMDYSIRRLSKNDLDTMRSLNVLFGDVFKDPESYHDHKPSDDYLRDFLDDERNIAVVALQDDKVVGGLVAYILDKFEKQRREVYLYDLAVSTEHQRKGVGRQLLDELKIIARELGAYVVFVQADEGDEAIAFYESLAPSENLRTRNFDFDV